MSKELFNAYGALVIPGETKERLLEEEDIIVSGATTTVYKTFSVNAGAIYRDIITETEGRTSISHKIAYGAWADRATLTYVPVNDPVEVV